MNYYGPRQRETDKQWDYTCRNDDRIWPVGYCAAFRDPDEPPSLFPWREDQKAEYRATKDKHHTTGHATSEEACTCFREYLLDHHLNLAGKYQDAWHKCVVCGQLTDRFAEIRHGQSFYLCDAHRTREEVEKLFGPLGEIISSY